MNVLIYLAVVALCETCAAYAKSPPVFGQQYSMYEVDLGIGNYSIHFDYPNQRERADMGDGTWVRIVLWNSSLEFDLNVTGKTCYQNKPYGHQNQFGWPQQHMTYSGQTWMDGVYCDHWIFSPGLFESKSHYYCTPDALPKPVRMYNQNFETTVETDWYNWTYGQPDASLFVVPPEYGKCIIQDDRTRLPGFPDFGDKHRRRLPRVA